MSVFIQLLKDFLKNHLPGTYKLLKSFFLHVYSVDVRKLRSILKQQCLQPPFESKAKVSILCCCFNTRIQELKEMLDSVLCQTYRNWELCLLNCSDSDHGDVGKILTFAARDVRIRLINSRNQGISLNSRCAAQYAEGEYFLLLDHDDILSPVAISDLLQAAETQQSEFVYADEYLLYPFGYRVRKKEDFDLFLLWHDNYLNHPVLIKKSLYDKVGGFRSGFDGSQDYDLYLRLAEKTKNIYHVRKPLYVWRIHENSFSQTELHRCINSGKKALEEHLARIGINAEVFADRNSAVFSLKIK